MMLPLIKTNTLEEYICDFDRSGFTYEWQNNQQRQISFTVYRTVYNADIFDLLQIGISIIFDGQEYVIQQATPKQVGNTITKDIVATHIMYECQKLVYQYNSKGSDDNPITMTIDEVMAYYFDGNNAGYTYEIKGTFSSASLSGVGNGSGMDGINKCVDTFGCYVWADNKKIILMDDDNFKTVTSKQFRYLYNTNDIQATIDRTNIVNSFMCYGKANQDESGNNTGYAFTPFMYADTDSINKWGLCYGPAISDDRFTNADSMKSYAATQAKPNPDVSLTMTYHGDDDVTEGEVWLFIAPLMGFESDVTVLGLQKYPYCSTKPSITLSNTLKDIYQIQREIAEQAKNARTSAGSALTIAKEAVSNQLQVEIVGEVDD